MTRPDWAGPFIGALVFAKLTKLLPLVLKLLLFGNVIVSFSLYATSKKNICLF